MLDQIFFYFPLVHPRRVEHFPLLDRKRELISEVESLILKSQFCDVDIDISFDVVDLSEEIEKVISESRWRTWPGIAWGYDQYLRVTFTSSYPGDEFVVSGGEGFSEGDNVREFWLDFLRGHAESELLVFQLASELAYPGGAISGASVCEIEGRFSLTEGRHSPVRHAYEHAYQAGMLSIDRISLEKVWDWLAKRNGLRLGGVGDTAAAKAICYLSHVFDESFHGRRFMGVVWACAGLEAFYGEDQSARAAQLIQKIPAFVPVDADVCKRNIQEIYKIRSSIIHGNKAISSAIAGDDGMPDKHRDEEYHATYNGVYYLTETLRACVVRGLESAKFSTIWQADSCSPSD